MFIGNLNNKQQSVFLGVAKKLIASDGTMTPIEEAMLAIMQSQMEHGVVAEEAKHDELKNIFDSKKSQASVMLELLGLAHADEDYHTSDADRFEKQFIHQVALACGISDHELNEMEGWVVRQFALADEAKRFMGE